LALKKIIKYFKRYSHENHVLHNYAGALLRAKMKNKIKNAFIFVFLIYGL
jgi:hypothetical protein